MEVYLIAEGYREILRIETESELELSDDNKNRILEEAEGLKAILENEFVDNLEDV